MVSRWDALLRKTKRTHSLFIDDLKMHQENHGSLKEANEVNVTASSDTGYTQYTELINALRLRLFMRSKMVEADGLQALEERTEAFEPGTNQSYKFLGCSLSGKITLRK